MTPHSVYLPGRRRRCWRCGCAPRPAARAGPAGAPRLSAPARHTPHRHSNVSEGSYECTTRIDRGLCRPGGAPRLSAPALQTRLVNTTMLLETSTYATPASIRACAGLAGAPHVSAPARLATCGCCFTFHDSKPMQNPACFHVQRHLRAQPVCLACYCLCQKTWVPGAEHMSLPSLLCTQPGMFRGVCGPSRCASPITACAKTHGCLALSTCPCHRFCVHSLAP